MTKQVRHVETGRILLPAARWCDSYFSRLRGFTWRRRLQPGEGLVLVETGESRVGSAITMLFCFLDLGVIWVNDAGVVVDTCLARPWRLSYTPQAPARYAIELAPSLLETVAVGEHIEFLDS